MDRQIYLRLTLKNFHNERGLLRDREYNDLHVAQLAISRLQLPAVALTNLTATTHPKCHVDLPRYSE